MALISRGLIAATPFGSSDSQVYSMITSTEVEHGDRLSRYREFMRFYRGKHWNHTRDINEPLVTMNYCRRFVDAQVNFLMKGGFSVVIPDDPATSAKEDEDREFVRLMLERTWERNRKELVAFEMAQMGAVTGDVFLRVSWEDTDPIEPPYARVDVLPSQFVFPSFGGPHGVDRKKVNSVLVIFPRFKNGEVLSSNRFGDMPTHSVEWYAERWFKNEVIIYEPDGTETRRSNPLNEIPIVHIPNYAVAGEFYGRSDLADVIDLQKEFNEKSTDISDVINYHGSPVTIVKGAKITQLERGPNRMWGLPENAEVSNLALNGELSASLEYLDRIKKAMHEISGVPEIALSSDLNTRETGASVAMRYMPMLETRQVKIQTYGAGLRLVNRLIMKMAAIADQQFATLFNKLDISNRYRNEIIFPSPLPRDESIELDRARVRLELGLTSKRYEMQQMGFSQREIEKIQEDIEEEKMEAAELEFEVGRTLVQGEEEDSAQMSAPPSEMEPEADDSEDMSEGEDMGEPDDMTEEIMGGAPKQNRGNPSPKRPNPDIQSDKVSRRAQMKGM